MLQFFRDNIKSWFFIIVLIIIIVPFIFFGINQFFTNTNDQSVAEVNGDEIPLAEYQFQLRQRNTTGSEPTEELKEQVVNSLVQQQLIQDGLGELGLRPSDKTIATELAQNTSFQVDGKFDQDRYQAVINSQFSSIQNFEEGFRNNLALTEFTNALDLTALNFTDEDTKVQVAQQAKQNLQTREFSWVNLTSEDLSSTVTVTEAEIKAYYDANLAKYEVGEGVKLQYLQLNLDEYLAQNQPTEAEVVKSYESNLSAHTKPGKRNLQYVTITNGTDLDKEILNTIKQEVAKLEGDAKSVDGIAKLVNDTLDQAGDQSVSVTVDSGEVADITQDIITGLFGKTIADQAFEAEQGTWTDFEPNNKDVNLLYVGKIFEQEQLPLEEVRETITKLLAQEKALPKLLEAQETLATIAFENPQSLQPAADALGIEIKTSDWIYQDGQGDKLLSAIPELVAYAFTETTTADGYNSDVIEADQDIIIARFAEKSEPRTLAFEDVSVDIEKQLVADKTRIALSSFANDLLAKAKSSGDAEGFFTEKGYEVVKSNEDLTRSESQDLYQLGIVSVAFSQPTTGFSLARVAPLENNHVAITWTTKATEVDENSEGYKSFMNNFKTSSARAVSQVEQASLIELYRENADVVIYNDRL